MPGAPQPIDPSQLTPGANGTAAEAAAAYDVLLGGPAYAVRHSAIHPRAHTDIQHSNPTHYERPAASPFPGGEHGARGIMGAGRNPFPDFTGGNPLFRGQRK